MTLGLAHAGLVADWTADTYVSGQNWTSNTGSIAATMVGNPITADLAFRTHKGVELDGTSYFTIDAAHNPLANTSQFTLVAVFQPFATGSTGDYWWQSAGLIGMEQNFANTDWGLGWNNDRIAGGVGGPDTTTFSQPLVFDAPQVAMYVWNAGTMRLYVNGVLADSHYFGPLAPRNTGAFALGAMTDGGAGPFVGRIAELRMYNTDETANAATIYSGLRGNYIAPLQLISSKMTPNGGSIVFRDTADTVSTTGTHSLFVDGTEIPVANLSRSKTGDTTTVNFTVGTPFTAGSTHSLDITVPLQSGSTQDLVVRSAVPRLPATIPGLAGSVGTWGISETVSPTNGAPGDMAACLAVITAASPPAPVTGSAPVFNHRDPDTNGVADIGNFNNDFNILTNTGADDNFIVVGKTQVTVPAAGLYTFSIHGDDGFAMRVSGAGGGHFISAGGDAQIDLGENQMLFRDGGTGDSNSRGVYQFDAAGTYDITYLGWDGGGGGYYEVAWAQGAFNADRDINTWALVGNPSAPTVPAYQERWMTNLPGPLGTANGFGMRTYREAGNLGGLNDANNFLKATTRVPGDGLTTDAQVPYINFRDPQDGGGGGSIPGDLPFPGNTDQVEDHVVTVAHGRINITSAGSYTFWAQGDDGFMLRIKGTNGAANPSFRRATQGDNDGGNGKFQMSHPNELFFAGGTGNSNTRGIVDLAVGTYDLDYIHVEQDGGFYNELTAAAGAWPHGSEPPGGFQLVGFVPPASAVIVPGIADPGWTVQSSEVKIVTNTIAGAEQRLEDTLANPNAPANKVSTWDKLDFFDPEDGSQGTFPNTNAWPLNTNVAENDFTIRASGIVNITQAGDYQFGFQGDDGGYLYIYGVGANADPAISSIVSTNHPGVAAIGQAPGSTVNNAIRVDTASGNSHTVVSVPLNVGQYRIQTLVFEIGGGFFWEVFGAKGPLDPSFVHPLLVKGSGSTVNLASGLPLVVQGTVTDPNYRVTNVVTVVGPPTTAQLTFNSQSGANYRVEASLTLASGSWTTVANNIAATGNSTTASVNLSGFPALNGKPKVFFRVQQN